MAHTKSCGNAQRDKCRCSGCGGSLHGWPGYLGLIDASPADRDKRREGAQQDWYSEVGLDEETRRSRLATPSPEMLGHATEAARVDIVDYLAKNPITVERVDQLGRLLFDEAFTKIKFEAGRRSARHPGMARIARVLPGHFWCSLLAAVAGATARADRAVDKVPEQAKELLEDGPPPDWGEAHELIAETAVEAVWECLRGFLGAWSPEEMLLVTRILAVLICPAPGRHPDVARLCLFPLGRGILQDTVTRMLQQSLAPG